MRIPWFYSRIVLSLLLLVFMVGPPSFAQEGTAEPTAPPTEVPTEVPTEPPTEAPTEVATEVPTELPTEVVTEPPPVEVTEVATEPPTEVPTLVEVTAEPTLPVEVTAEATLETLLAPAPLVARVEPITEASLMAIQTFVVNSTGDASDVTLNGICDADPAPAVTQCTLRAALQEANADLTPDKDTINFSIPGTGLHTITPGTALPPITQPIIINGASEPYYTWATPRIVLAGSLASPLSNGLVLDTGSDGSTIKGLVINGNWGYGIRVLSANDLIQGNFFGTNAAGTAADSNVIGVLIFGAGATNSTIGGTTAALRNVISGNGFAGVALDSNASGNRVQGNYIGTNKGGTLAVSNDWGALVDGVNSNTIGGTTAAARNVISGNSSGGVWLGGDFNLVVGNYIGTNAAGTGAIPNTGPGVEIVGNGNIVGGAFPQAGNRIANNGGDGIFVNSGTDNRLFTNWIYNNAGLGIDLFAPTDPPSGVTGNDGGDIDTGANDLQNWPIMRRTMGTRYIGDLNSTANQMFRLQFFASPTCDSLVPGFTLGEGQRYLGTAFVVTDGSGDASFDLLLPVAATTGWAVTATATSESFNTSEFSNCVKANLGTPVLLGPANNSLIYDTTPTVSWKAVPGAEQYLVELSLYPTFAPTKSFAFVSAPATSHTFGSPLERVESYYWHVRTLAFSHVGAWSATWRINIGV